MSRFIQAYHLENSKWVDVGWTDLVAGDASEIKNIFYDLVSEAEEVVPNFYVAFEVSREQVQRAIGELLQLEDEPELMLEFLWKCLPHQTVKITFS